MKILDAKALLKPINEKIPTGEDVRSSSSTQTLYLKLRDARQAARAIERQSMQGVEGGSNPDWQTVCDQAIELLSTYTKDLEITAWLCEALLRLHGFTGLTEGFLLIKNYIENYWDYLYPMPDEEGIYSRVAPLVGLNGNDMDGTLIVPIAKLPLTQGEIYSLWQFQQAMELLKISPEKREQRIAAGSYTLEMIEASAAETSPEFFQALLQEIKICLHAFEDLDEILNQKCGADAPPSSRIRGKLQECLNAVQAISKKSLGKTVNIEKNTVPLSENVDNHEAPIQPEREEVLRSILKAANFFRQCEPHSPLPYLLERAVRWGKTPLPALWRELIEDEQAWNRLRHLTGIEI